MIKMTRHIHGGSRAELLNGVLKILPKVVVRVDDQVARPDSRKLARPAVNLRKFTGNCQDYGLLKLESADCDIFACNPPLVGDCDRRMLPHRYLSGESKIF